MKPLKNKNSQPTEPAQPTRIELSIDLAAGDRVRLTIESTPGGGPPVVIQEKLTSDSSTPPLQPSPIHNPFLPIRRILTSLRGFFSRQHPLDARWLFGLGLAVYLLVHLAGLARFPIYFFCDEAANPVLAANLTRDKMHGTDGDLLPTFFKNGGQYSLSTSVYIQWLPTLVFGKSVFVTRAVFALISILAAVWLALILKQVFKLGRWWTAPLLLAMMPAWFLFSRAAFECSLQVTFYAGFLYYYLRYRTDRPRFLYAALVCGALSFYSYTPGQVIMVLTGILLLVSDWRYHWQNRRTALIGLGVLALLALPLLRFVVTHPGELYGERLKMYDSYWIQEGLSGGQKVLRFFREYGQGFNPLYWFLPNQVDELRYIMRGYGHLGWWLLPFVLGGLALAVRHFRKPEVRVILAALLAAPSGGAMAEVNVARSLVIVLPAVLLASLALDLGLEWVARRWKWRPWRVTLVLTAMLAAIPVLMLNDALINGPTWYSNYGMNGLQWGAMQVYPAADEYQKQNPDELVIISPNWTFQSEVLREFFVPNNPAVQMGTTDQVQEIFDPDLARKVFVLPPGEFEHINDRQRFKDVQAVQKINYPDGRTGFYFTRLIYRDDIETFLKAEQEANYIPVSSTLEMLGQTVTAAVSPLDGMSVSRAFDGDLETLIKTRGANPLILELDFPSPPMLQGVVVHVGAEPIRITVLVDSGDGSPAQTYEVEGELVDDYKDVTILFSTITRVKFLHIEVLDFQVPQPSPVHLWEVTLLKP